MIGQFNLRTRLNLIYGNQQVDAVFNKIRSSTQFMPLSVDEQQYIENVIVNLTAIVLKLTRKTGAASPSYPSLEENYSTYRSLFFMPMAQRDGFANMAASMMLAKDFVIAQELELAATRDKLFAR